MGWGGKNIEEARDRESQDNGIEAKTHRLDKKTKQKAKRKKENKKTEAWLSLKAIENSFF